MTRPFTWYHNFVTLWPWPWPWPLTYFWKTLTLVRNFWQEKIWLSYCTSLLLWQGLSHGAIIFNSWPWRWILAFYWKILTLAATSDGCHPASVVVIWQVLFRRSCNVVWRTDPTYRVNLNKISFSMKSICEIQIRRDQVFRGVSVFFSSSMLHPSHKLNGDFSSSLKIYIKVSRSWVDGLFNKLRVSLNMIVL